MIDIAALQAEYSILVLDISALRRTIGGGVLRVTYADRTVQYQSTADMMAALRMMLSRQSAIEAALGLASRGRVTRQITFIANKGL